MILRVLLLSCALLLGACAGAGPDDDPPVSGRIEEVRALRQAMGRPAVALGEATAAVHAEVRDLRLDAAPDPATRAAAIAAAREQRVAALADAIRTAAATDVPGDGPDVAAAGEAWDAAVGAARQVAAAAEAEADLAARLAAADATLHELTGTWDEPGSRREQLAALAATAERADVLAAELEEEAAVPGCLPDLQVRRDAAAFVAAATRELRQHVSAQRGNAFDDLRRELEADPYGAGGPLTALPAGAERCWDEGSGVARGADELEQALVALQAALNPADLGTPDPS